MSTPHAVGTADNAPLLSDDLLRRFDTPGPRYTSYPTADRFVEAFGAEDACAALRQRADAVLRDIAGKLGAQVRKSDTVARLGGDEFAVLLDNCPVGHARQIAEKMRQAVVDYRLDWEGQQFSIGASIGLVRVDASFSNAKDVLAAADNACYAAKHRGRNCVVVYGD